VFVGPVNRLEKRLTRAYRRTLFGSIGQSVAVDGRLHPAHKSTSSRPGAAAALGRRSHVTAVAPGQGHLPIALARPLAGPVLALLHERVMLRSLPMALGPLQGFRLNLGRSCAH
jgi:hypothetical protein